MAVDSDNFSPIYQGPLAQAQRRLLKTQGIQAAMEAAAPILQMMPQTLDKIDGDKLLESILESFSFPQKAIRDEKTVQALRDARTQAQAEENEKQNLMDTANSMKGVKSAVEADQISGGALSQAAGGLLNG
jgi:hypothetical protein